MHILAFGIKINLDNRKLVFGTKFSLDDRKITALDDEIPQISRRMAYFIVGAQFFRQTSLAASSFKSPCFPQCRFTHKPSGLLVAPELKLM